MKKTKQKSKATNGARPVFDAMRKPLPPPGHALSQAKPEERAHPAGRKAKHKRRDSSADETAD